MTPQTPQQGSQTPAPQQQQGTPARPTQQQGGQTTRFTDWASI
ncbi:hypothetical protein SAMN05421774_101530 [Gemmobacter megaterium]|uniref:Uncharacterized protein n=1 Tax=Gemmobacter megaterium TaxID=1086013 RepID=A0A1N7KLM6_9RHOB|nr:hypothetical protein [Gemmobacter megaterium]SIS62483.1 hypothetical protein SAMN05421774_101530 [Gemmobacter megaterium]